MVEDVGEQSGKGKEKVTERRQEDTHEFDAGDVGEPGADEQDVGRVEAQRGRDLHPPGRG